jgi:hypothetical protein
MLHGKKGKLLPTGPFRLIFSFSPFGSGVNVVGFLSFPF